MSAEVGGLWTEPGLAVRVSGLGRHWPAAAWRQRFAGSARPGRRLPVRAGGRAWWRALLTAPRDPAVDRIPSPRTKISRTLQTTSTFQGAREVGAEWRGLPEAAARAQGGGSRSCRRAGPGDLMHRPCQAPSDFLNQKTEILAREAHNPSASTGRVRISGACDRAHVCVQETVMSVAPS